MTVHTYCTLLWVGLGVVAVWLVNHINTMQQTAEQFALHSRQL